MTKLQRIIINAEIDEIELTVPPGHHHLRAIIRLQTGEELVPRRRNAGRGQKGQNLWLELTAQDTRLDLRRQKE